MIIAIILLYIIISISALTIKDRKHSARLLYLLIGIGMVFIAGFRGDIDRDSFSYVTLYNLISTVNVEPTFTAISYIVKTLFDNVAYLFIIYAIIGVSLKLIAIRQLSTLWFLSVALYLSEFFILHDMTQIRIGVASGILLLCIKPIYDRNIVKFLLFTSIAILFHYSAIIILPLWFLTFRPDSNKIFYWLIPIGYLMWFLNIGTFILNIQIPIPYIQSKLDLYRELQLNQVSGFNNINVFGKIFLLKSAIYYLLLYKKDYISMYNRYAPLLIRIYGIGLFSFLALSAIPVLAFRVFEFYGIVYIILFPFLFYILNVSPLLTKYISKVSPRIDVSMVSNAIILSIGALILYVSLFYVDLLR